ncbi:MAG: hypothetical protein ACRDRL_31845 [Sciscionella sp.]
MSTGSPLGRAEALARLRSGFEIVADQAALFDGAEDDRERRSLLLALITSAWELRDRATGAYEALVREGEQGGIARGVLE